MRFLFCTSFFIAILLTGCQSAKPKHLVPVTDDCTSLHIIAHHCTSLPTPFSFPTFEKALLKASLEIREHHLTGLVFIKKMPDAGCRIIFSNEFGMTYFDLEIGSDTFLVHYCFEPLNKKALWKIMETDLRLLFATEEASGETGKFIQKETNYLVFKNKQENLTRWDLFSSGGDTLVETRGRSNLADQVVITFTNYQQGFPSRIILLNSFVKIKLSLSLLSIN